MTDGGYFLALGNLSDEEAAQIRKAVQDYFSGAGPRIEAGATSKWISVEDDLPNDGEEVWICDEEYDVVVGFYNRGDWYHVYGDDDGLGDDRLYEVTHWMPMDRPEPPGREGEG